MPWYLIEVPETLQSSGGSHRSHHVEAVVTTAERVYEALAANDYHCNVYVSNYDPARVLAVSADEAQRLLKKREGASDSFLHVPAPKPPEPPEPPEPVKRRAPRVERLAERRQTSESPLHPDHPEESSDAGAGPQKDAESEQTIDVSDMTPREPFHSSLGRELTPEEDAEIDAFLYQAHVMLSEHRFELACACYEQAAKLGSRVAEEMIQLTKCVGSPSPQMVCVLLEEHCRLEMEDLCR